MDSDRVNQLDFPAEVFYRRLMSKVDDYGLYDARPSFLRSMLYPLRGDRVREADCSRWIAACVKAGLIALYQHGGKPFLQMLDTKWQVRAEPKYPRPTDEGSAPLLVDNNGCFQLQTTVPVFGDVFVVEDVPPSSARADGGRFERFWTRYPRKVGKDAARKAFEKRKPDDQLLAVMLAAIDAQSRSDAWTKEGGQFIPHPSTWLSQGRWQDETSIRLVQPESAAAEVTQRFIEAQKFDPEEVKAAAARAKARREGM